MKTSTSDGKHGIQWTGCMQLDDWNFTEDLVLLSHTHQQMQMKTTSLVEGYISVGLNIYKGGSNILKYITWSTKPVTLNREDLEEVGSFTYLDSIINEQEGSDTDLNVGIGKVMAAFLQSKNIQNSKQLSTNIKVTIFNKNVKTVLLYGAETSRTTTIIIKRVKIFISTCLCKTPNVR
ncbi:unnamed protein product [Schistosoma margrebowiei]|uniref:Uncharacterized protein n=1 Tax=Schistosoma margrebowiei TaxID=48269 RepID=A0A183LQR6_9TREM|nr:unnamed protein product [Schistosoma margrebowiei]